ncbi:MAG: fused MFS/spermidine synthase [Candidatus Lindowbacteria bacterium]|nr:fused MFS/spermidine synthase [Candidatus Lindowbacteria bacterium]
MKQDLNVRTCPLQIEQTQPSKKALPHSFAVFFVLFFFSGLCALVYEVTWTRRLTLIFGNTVYSVSTVLVAFMGGLAFGSVWFGRFVDKRQDPIKTYGWLETGIGVSALFIPLALSVLNPVYRVLYEGAGASSFVMTLARFTLSVAVLIIPTTFMGATLPVLSRFVIRQIEKRGAGIGSLYAINTFGAVAGCFLAGFVLPGWLGITRSEQAAASINIAIGLTAFYLSRRYGRIPQQADVHDTSQTTEGDATYDRGVLRFVLLIVGISGLLALGYEVLWTRILIFLLGSSIYSFSMILVVHLLGLTAGSLLSARFIDRSKRPLNVFGWLEILIGLTVFAGLLLFRGLPFTPYTLSVKPLSYLSRNFLSTLIIVLPPTIFMGATFPVAVRIYARSLGSVGRQTGALYAVNTVGAVLGSFAAGFALIPVLGSKNSMMLLILLSVIAGLSLLYLSMKKEGATSLNWLAGALVILPLAGFPYSNDLLKELSVRFMKKHPARVIAFKEDETAAVAVIQGEKGFRVLAVNGVAMTILCTETQLMAHIPLAIAPKPKNLLGICFGMGTTFVSARAAGLDVDYVELCPYVFRAFKYFQSDPRMLKEPGVRKIIADGRNYLLLSDKSYDVITIDPPPPPWSAGAVNLYTEEFYELCKERVAPEGIVCQWLPTIHDCFTEDQFKMCLRTFIQVFPHTSVWASPGNMGAYLLGTPERLSIDEASFTAYFDAPAIKSDLALYSTEPWDGPRVLSLLVADEDAARAYVGDAPAMTDDLPLIEFPLFRVDSEDRIMEVEMIGADAVKSETAAFRIEK